MKNKKCLGERNSTGFGPGPFDALPGAGATFLGRL